MVQLSNFQGIWYCQRVEKRGTCFAKGLAELKLSIYSPLQSRQLQAILLKTYRGSLNKRCTHLLQDWDEKMSCILIQNCNPCPAATQLGTCLNSEGTSLSHNPPQYLQFYFCHAQNCPYLSYLASYSHLSPVRTPKESGALESLKYT